MLMMLAFRGAVTSETPLLLSLLGVGGRTHFMLPTLGPFVATEGKAQLMLMILGISAAMSPAKLGWCFRCSVRAAVHDALASRADQRQSPNDAHDACAFLDEVTSKTRLVLSLLRRGRQSQANADDAWAVRGGGRISPADAHDVWAFRCHVKTKSTTAGAVVALEEPQQ